MILDNSGFSKGYGFVRFGSEEEMRDSLINMNGYIGLGTKSLKISNAVPKPKGDTPGGTVDTTPPSNYNQYYDASSYWQNYAANWQQVSISATVFMLVLRLDHLFCSRVTLWTKLKLVKCSMLLMPLL